MRYALTAEQMRVAENRAIAEGAETVVGMMEYAGAALASEVERRVPSGPVVVLCGPGNNGGDGWVAARLLRQAGRPVRVLCGVAPTGMDADALPEASSAAAVAVASGVDWTLAGEPDEARDAISRASVVIDALFGFGFRGCVAEPYAGLIALLEGARALVVSADIPSGVHADTGAVEGPTVRADVTVAFGALKRGHVMQPGAALAGEVVVADVGVAIGPAEQAEALAVPTAADLRPVFPLPSPGDHKGVRGRVAIVAGSTTYTGAAVLAVQGALRLGPGFVIAVVPAPIADILRLSSPGILVRPVPAAPDGAFGDIDAVLEAVADADAVVLGPGVTTGGVVRELARALIASCAVPLLLDADALNAVQDEPAVFGARTAPLVITPHPGEAARLLGPGPSATGRVETAQALAALGVTCLLKGAGTLVVDEARRAIVTSGNAGLARAGSGDVLAGMIGTLLAQGVSAFDAAVLGAYLHGRAADLGVVELTQTCFTSSDITRFLPGAVREVVGG